MSDTTILDPMVDDLCEDHTDITEIINKYIESSQDNTEEERINTEHEIINRYFISTEDNNNENY